MTIHVPHLSGSSTNSLAERIQMIRSPGGIEAWLFEDHTLPILSASIGFKGVAALDPTNKSGTARIMADLLVKGAGPLDGEHFAQALADDAIRLSFSVDRDGLRGQLQTRSRTADRAFEFLRLALSEPHFAPEFFERARAAAAARVRQDLVDPNRIATRTFLARGFAGHPYARPVDGDLTSIAAIEIADVAALHRRMVSRHGLLVAVVGAIGPEALGSLLDQAFADLPDGETTDTPPVALAGLGERYVTPLDVPHASILLGRPAIPLNDPDFAAAQVVNHCFGGGTFTSSLVREIREKRGLCYAIQSALITAAAASTFVVLTSVANECVDETLDLIAKEGARFSTEGIAAEDMAAAKGALIGAYGLNFDTSVSISQLCLSLQFEGRSPEWVDERNRLIAAVTTEDLARAIGRLFGDGAMLVSIAGDPTAKVHA